MAKFGKYIKTVCSAKWKNHYFDYKKIKKKISELKKQEQIEFKTLITGNTEQIETWTEDLDPLEIMIKSKIGKYIQLFLISIESEIKKFSRFYVEFEREIYLKLNSHLHNKHSYQNFLINQTLSELNRLEKLILEIIDLAEYINVNLTAIRKIFKKFDKKFNLKNNPVALYYLRKKLSDSSSSLVYILQFKIIDESSALIEELVKSLEEIYEVKKRKIMNSKNKNEVLELLEEPLLKEMDLAMISGNPDIVEIDKLFKQKFSKIKELNEKIDYSNKLFRNNSNFWRLNSLNEGFNMKNIEEYKDAMVEYIQEENILENLIPQVESKYGFKKEKINLTNVWLIIIHTFLYMMNYFIVQPTNSDYLKKMNLNPILTGLVLSMTPLASIISTFIYSKILHLGYRHSYLISLLCFITGNFLYSFADYTSSLSIMMAGRFLVGLGGARVVNRRYLTEEVPDHLILNYSFCYAIMLAIGTSAGPGFAFILTIIPDFEFIGLNFNLFTNPGWLCMVIWIVYSVIVLTLFEEVQNHKKLYKSTDADLTNNQLMQKDLESFRYSELNKINDNFTVINLVAKDIQTLIDKEEMNFSYLSISCYMLGAILFLIRMTTECLFVVAPLILSFYYGFSYLFISLFSCVVSILVSLGLNCFSKQFSERYLIKILILCCLVCCIGLIRLNIWELKFIPFCLLYSVLFISASLLESIDLSLLTKIMPNNYNQYANKFMNPSLAIILTTTGGRFMGSILVSIFGVFGLDAIHNITFIVLLILFVLAYILVISFYNYLRVKAISRIIKKNF